MANANGISISSRELRQTVLRLIMQYRRRPKCREFVIGTTTKSNPTVFSPKRSRFVYVYIYYLDDVYPLNYYGFRLWSIRRSP